MNRIARVIALLVLALTTACAGASATNAPAPVEPEPPSTTVAVTMTAETIPTTTTITIAVSASAPTVTSPPSTDCWMDLARAVGWPEETLAHLEFIIRRESGCDPSAFADRPWTFDLSRGLLQINAYGSLDAGLRRLCGIDPATLFDPAVNLTCGLAYWRAMGWAPWGG